MSKLKQHISSSMVLIICTVLALICANVPGIKETYFNLWSNTVSFSIGDFNFFSHNGHSMTLMEVINDFLMAIFFLSVGLEIKREIRVGELSTREKALLPIIGACGGMIVPVLVFSLVCPHDAAMQRGLAIPMATDIAFSLGILAIFKSRVPLGLKMFLAALAVADDLGGIIVIALFYSYQRTLSRSCSCLHRDSCNRKYHKDPFKGVLSVYWTCPLVYDAQFWYSCNNCRRDRSIYHPCISQEGNRTLS